jgi:cation/acetate symporter
LKTPVSAIAVIVFLAFVGFVLGLSFYLGRKAKSSRGYYAAHGEIGWFINGVAFAGDYLSAASFLGICGMLAFYGYDGFLYSIGFLAGWIVALLLIAEPIKRLGKFTFADALNAKFASPGIQLVAAISTLIVSVAYLIPQMVGAGSLVQPLLGLTYMWGVVIVGVVVILIVATAGMVSTTWVQFIKGSLLVLFCFILTILILYRGLSATADPMAMVPMFKPAVGETAAPAGTVPLHFTGQIAELPGGVASTGPLGPLEYLKIFQDSKVILWKPTPSKLPAGTLYTPHVEVGNSVLLPGAYPLFKGVRSPKLADKLDFFSLMLALFAGTASLPHILIRYYTVKNAAAARKSTVVGIGTIGFFYMLTLFLGLGAMTSGKLNVSDSNMSAPLLASSFGTLPFALISAIAFTTVLGTVSGLIMAASGAVAHDLISNYLQIPLDDHQKVIAGKCTAVVVGIIAMALGWVFRDFNVGFLVGWAFNIAASANLPALVMLLFWSRTTRQGMIAAISVGLVSSLTWLLLSAPAYKDIWHSTATPIAPFSQPGLVTIPLGFVVLVAVSLCTKKTADVRLSAAV